MTMLPTASLGSPRRAPAILNQKDRARERALVLIFAIAAIAAGVLAAVAPYTVLAFAGGLLLIALAAWTLPLAWLGPVLAALIPFQFYLPVPTTSFTLRAALVFAFAIALRMAINRRSWSAVRGRPSAVLNIAWLLPAGLFLVAAFVAALGAQDRYAAFKGIYDWLVVLLTAFVVAALGPTTGTVRRILSVLIAGGVAQALLGLLQYALGLNTILELLRLPVSGLLYQPNLLKDKLGDLSFNWVAFDRALPFGTFVNGIDYAVFLAAILCLIIALVVAREQASAIDLSLRGVPLLLRDDEAIPNMAERAREGSAFTTPPTGARNDTAPCRQTWEQPSAVGGPRSTLVVLGQRSWLALGVSSLVIAVALLLTFKGSGFLALMGGTAVIAFASIARLSRRTVAVGLVVLVGVLVVALPFADLISQRALFLVQREQGSLGTAGRLQIWASLFQFIAQRPLFGYGLNNSIALIAPQWTLRDGAPGFVFSTPESAYISALVETGLVGFAALAGWLSAAVANGYRRTRDSKEATLYVGIVAALVALLFGNFTVSGLTTDQNGMLLGMLIGLIYGTQNDD